MPATSSDAFSVSLLRASIQPTSRRRRRADGRDVLTAEVAVWRLFTFRRVAKTSTLNRPTPNRPVWMAPALQGLFDGVATKSATVFCPACCRAVVEPLALMVSADRVPICLTGSNALDIRRVVHVSGLTGSPSRLIVLAIVERLCAFERSIGHAVPSVMGWRAR